MVGIAAINGSPRCTRVFDEPESRSGALGFHGERFHAGLLYGKAEGEIREALVAAEFEGWSLAVGSGFVPHSENENLAFHGRKGYVFCEVKEETIDTHSKALKINLDPRWYGTFAEIGAGQEVVRWFFRVGGAAGTIAKSISAYDMKVSDAIYGHAERYVSRGRLQAMLDREFDLDVERLAKDRGDNTSFFAFADTVVARSYRGGNEFHGWMGIKFQSRVRDEPSQIVMHVRMLDAEASLQQEALGIVGVNLCYGAFFLSHVPEELIESLLDKLTTGRVEIDAVRTQRDRISQRGQSHHGAEARAAGTERRGHVWRESRGAAAIRRAA